MPEGARAAEPPWGQGSGGVAGQASSPPCLPGLPGLPVLDEGLRGAGVCAVGMDVVHVPGLAFQLTVPGTVYAERAFTPAELRQARSRADAAGSLQAEHLAARWAAKEAMVKAWSQCLGMVGGPARAPQVPVEALDWREIEVVCDRQGRPSLRLAGRVREAVEELLGPEGSRPQSWPVSLSHDGEWAAAVVLAVRP